MVLCNISLVMNNTKCWIIRPWNVNGEWRCLIRVCHVAVEGEMTHDLLRIIIQQGERHHNCWRHCWQTARICHWLAINLDSGKIISYSLLTKTMGCFKINVISSIMKVVCCLVWAQCLWNHAECHCNKQGPFQPFFPLNVLALCWKSVVFFF